VPNAGRTDHDDLVNPIDSTCRIVQDKYR
jgi:hypothetical protein